MNRLSGFPNNGRFRVRLTEKDYCPWRTDRVAGCGIPAKESLAQADG